MNNDGAIPIAMIIDGKSTIQWQNKKKKQVIEWNHIQSIGSYLNALQQ